MKICFLADAGSIHTARWCDHFASLGYEVHVITFRNANIKSAAVHYIDAGAIDVSGGNWKVLLKVPEVKRLLRKIKPHILHAHYATSYGLVGALANYHPYVVTALGSDVLISPKSSAIYRMVLRFVFRRSDWATAMAEHMRNAMLDLGVPPQKVTTVPFGIDPAVFNAKQRQLPADRFVITSTRNFESVYNLPHLIKAISKVRSEINDLQLNLIGDGSKRAEVERLVKDEQLDDVTKFFGRIPQPEIAKVLNGSHVFVTVSLSDGNNISLNEAMACGTYPIATDIPANTQWIDDKVNGRLVPVNDVDTLAAALLDVYRNYGSIQQKAFETNQRIISKKAIWSTNMAIVEEHYKKLNRQ